MTDTPVPPDPVSELERWTAHFVIEGAQYDHLALDVDGLLCRYSQASALIAERTRERDHFDDEAERLGIERNEAWAALSERDRRIEEYIAFLEADAEKRRESVERTTDRIRQITDRAARSVLIEVASKLRSLTQAPEQEDKYVRGNTSNPAGSPKVIDRTPAAPEQEGR